MTKLNRIALLTSFAVALIISSSTIFAADDIDKTPSWYNGKKPWSSISRAGREEILSIRRKFEANKSKANEPSNQQVSVSSVNKGEQLIDKTLKQ